MWSKLLGILLAIAAIVIGAIWYVGWKKKHGKREQMARESRDALAEKLGPLGARQRINDVKCVLEKRHCPFCGGEIDGDEVYCESCGSKSS